MPKKCKKYIIFNTEFCDRIYEHSVFHMLWILRIVSSTFVKRSATGKFIKIHINTFKKARIYLCVMFISRVDWGYKGHFAFISL